MARNINERIEHADAGDGRKQKEQNMLPDDFYFCKKIFPCKRKNDDRCGKPSIKSKSDRWNIFDDPSCDNKITRPDKSGKNRKADADKNLALVMCSIHE